MSTRQTFISLTCISLILIFNIDNLSAQTCNPPSNVTAVVDSVSRNLITWIDETTITGETYNIYVSESEITFVHASDVVKVGRNIPEAKQLFLHTLFTPSDTGTVNYFYAVTSVDPNGVENETVITGSNATPTSIANKAIAVGNIPLISKQVTIDGDISEFLDVMPFVMDSTRWVEGMWDSPDDLSALVYLMVDMKNLYIAVAVTDNALVQNYSGFSTWNGDSFELNIGLYPIPAKLSHRRFSRGAEPDYQFRFSINEETWLHVPWPGRSDSGPPNHVITYPEMVVAPVLDGYIMEIKIPFTEIVGDPKIQNHIGGSDSLFIPEDGMVVPIDFTLNDADVDVYEGHIYYFWEGEDIQRPYQSPLVWTQTIIGDFQTSTNVADRKIDIPSDFTLLQNYPNPFNSSTTIKFSLEKKQHISLKIYNLNGQLIRNLASKQAAAGVHSIHWDGLDEFGSIVSSGVYTYRLTSDRVSVLKKMVLVK